MTEYEEQVVGVAGNAEDEIIIAGRGNVRYLCTNCNRNVHCIAGAKKNDPVEILRETCSNKNCMCTCKTHYIAKNGRLKKLGTVDDTDPLQDLHSASIGKKRTTTDELIDKLNAQIKEKPEQKADVPLS